jgi:transposase
MGRRPLELPEAFALAEQGLSRLDIARALGVSLGAVVYWAQRNGIQLPKRSTRPIPDSERQLRWTKVKALAESGIHVAEIARQTGVSHGGVTQILLRSGVPLPKKVWRAKEREQKMASMYRQGLSLEKVASEFDLTRERVRQILRKMEISRNEGGASKRIASNKAAERNSREARCLAMYGVSLVDWKRYSLDGTVSAYRYQKHNSANRGISWALTFAQWLDVWTTSGKLNERGRGRGKYVMSRIRDTGGYEIGNVHIKSAVDNSKEAVKKWLGKTKANPGVFNLYPGMARPWLAKVASVHLGYYATEGEAVAARMDYIQAHGYSLSSSGRVLLKAA